MCIKFFLAKGESRLRALILTIVSLPYFNTIENSEYLDNLKRDTIQSNRLAL